MVSLKCVFTASVLVSCNKLLVKSERINIHCCSHTEIIGLYSVIRETIMKLKYPTALVLVLLLAK